MSKKALTRGLVFICCSLCLGGMARAQGGSANAEAGPLGWPAEEQALWEGYSETLNLPAGAAAGTRNAERTFTDIVAGLTGVMRGSLDWGDYDNDGDLDLALAGRDSDYGAVSKIYRNDGDGTFTDIGASLTGVYWASLGWGSATGCCRCRRR